MISVTVPCNYSPMLTRICQYLNCFFNFWVSQDSCGNCSFILTNTASALELVGYLAVGAILPGYVLLLVNVKEANGLTKIEF